MILQYAKSARQIVSSCLAFKVLDLETCEASWSDIGINRNGKLLFFKRGFCEEKVYVTS
jgi:hypothetical protein